MVSNGLLDAYAAQDAVPTLPRFHQRRGAPVLLSSAEARDPYDLPLCRQYLHVHVGVVIAFVMAQGTNEQAVGWALGLTEPGERELLGAWDLAQTAEGSLTSICDALSARGVERVAYLSTNLPASVGKGSAPAHIDNNPALGAGQRVLPWGAEYLGLPMPHRLGSLNHPGARRRDRLSGALNFAASMQCDIERAVRRHRSFGSTQSARNFVIRTLSRLQHQLGASAPVVPKTCMPCARAAVVEQSVGRRAF